MIKENKKKFYSLKNQILLRYVYNSMNLKNYIILSNYINHLTKYTATSRKLIKIL